MSDDALKEYRDATAAYTAAQARARDVLKPIEALGGAIGHYLEPLITQVFGLPTPGKQAPLPAHYRIDLDQWPDAAKLKLVVTEWHAAFTRLHVAWGKVQDADRTIAKLPPGSLRLN